MVTMVMDTRRQASIDRALAKAHEQARAGNLPQLQRGSATSDGVSRWTFTVGSRTTGGVIYRVWLCDDHGIMTTGCDCEALGMCWHRSAARLCYAGKLACYRIEAVSAAVVAEEGRE